MTDDADELIALDFLDEAGSRRGRGKTILSAKTVMRDLQPRIDAAFRILSAPGEFSINAYANRIELMLSDLDFASFKKDIARRIATADIHRRSAPYEGTDKLAELPFADEEHARAMVIRLGGARTVAVAKANWAAVQVKTLHQSKAQKALADSSYRWQTLSHMTHPEMAGDPTVLIEEAMYRLGKWKRPV